MAPVLFGGTAIRLTKCLRKAIVDIKAKIHGNVDDAPAACELRRCICQASAPDILHNGYANIRIKHTIVMIGGEPCNLCKLGYSYAFLQMLLDIINTVLDAHAIVHSVPPPDRYEDYSR